MTFDPLNGIPDLVITTRELLNTGMNLFAGYRVHEYHRFQTKQSQHDWLQLNVQKKRMKILVFLTETQVLVNLPSIYYTDLRNGTPIYYGCYTKDHPKYIQGELAVYMIKPQAPMFPIVKKSDGCDFCVIGNNSYGLYRATHVDYLREAEES